MFNSEKWTFINQTKKYLTLVSITLILSSCASMYELPKDTPKASLNISSDLDAVTVQAFEDENCTNTQYWNRLAFFAYSYGDPHSGVIKEIKAEKEFFFTYTLSDGVYGITDVYECNITLGFTPYRDGVYRTHFGLTKGSDLRMYSAGKCFVTLERKTKDGSWVEEESLRQVARACVNTWDG